MSSFEAVKADMFDMLVEYVAESKNLGYCNGCRDLYFDQNCGCYDCPGCLDCTTCEHNPMSELDSIASELASKLWEIKQ